MHTLLWLSDQDGEAAPTFWTHEESIPEDEMPDFIEGKMKALESFADAITTTDPSKISCGEHEVNQNGKEKCDSCQKLMKMAEKYQTHRHSFSCHKKLKTITIQANEGFGRDDGKRIGSELKNIPVC